MYSLIREAGPSNEAGAFFFREHARSLLSALVVLLGSAHCRSFICALAHGRPSTLLAPVALAAVLAYQG